METFGYLVALLSCLVFQKLLLVCSLTFFLLQSADVTRCGHDCQFLRDKVIPGIAGFYFYDVV